MPKRYATRSDELHSIDLADFRRWGVRGGQTGLLKWSRGGEVVASVGYQMGDHALRLIYRVDGEPVDETFRFAFTHQHLGGMRRWLVCPGCGRRARVVWGGQHFRCRYCYDLTYESQYERWRVPGLATANRVRERLGGEPGLAHRFPDKPKGMHWRTYYRHRENDWDAEERMAKLLRPLILALPD